MIKYFKNSYNISSSNILIFFQIEKDNSYEQSLINNVEYAVFKNNLERLDLSLYENEIKEISYQLNTTMINMSKVFIMPT